MADQENQVFTTITVAAGQSTVFEPAYPTPRLTVTALPGVGGSALVETNNSPPGSIDSDAYVAWAYGSVSAVASDNIDAVISALRLSATTQPATFYVSQMKGL